LRLDQSLQGAFRAGKPILGICLGTQIILERSEENGTDCLGLIRGRVIRFPEPLSDGEGRTLKVPHMGWNRVEFARHHPLFEGIDPASEFYFVHSFYPVPTEAERILGKTDHGIRFPSVLEAGNLVAVQFHPEKSGRAGLRILENFCSWTGGAHA
jgi:glutamine amidotransferase